MSGFLKLIQDREAARSGRRGPRSVEDGMLSVLEGGSNDQVLSPVGSGGSFLAPVNRSTLPSVLAAGRSGGLVAHGGNIEAVKHIFNVHAKGEVEARDGQRYKCFKDHGLSSDGKMYLNFESTWTFKAKPPAKSGVDYWVKQKLLRIMILYCPKDKETRRIERLFNEMFRLKGTQTDAKNPDKHTDAWDYLPECDGRTTWCQMSCYELGILSLKQTDDTGYNEDYSRTEETESYTSQDRGASWGPREGHDDGPGQPGQHSPPDRLKDVPDYLGYYIADYFIEHCPPGPPWHTMVPVNRDPEPPDTGGGTPTPPDTSGGTPTPPDTGGGTPTPRDWSLAQASQTPIPTVASEPTASESVRRDQAVPGLRSVVE